MPGDATPCAVVGCGPRAEGHARAVAASERFRLVAGCDVDAAAAARFGEANGVPTGQAVEALADLLGERVREALVVLATPPSARLDVLRDVCRSRPAAVLVEKPLARTWREVVAIAATARHSGTRLFVNQQLRLLPGMATVASRVASGELGPVTTVYAASRASWEEHGPHLVDLVGAVLGGLDWRRVTATAEPARDRHDLSTVEQVLAAVELSGGPRLIVECGPAAPRWKGLPNPWHQMGFEVLAERGRATFALNRGWRVDGPGGPWSKPYVHDEEDDGSQVRLLDEIAAAMSGGPPSPSSLEAQWAAIALQHAVPAAAARRAAIARAEIPPLDTLALAS